MRTQRFFSFVSRSIYVYANMCLICIATQRAFYCFASNSHLPKRIEMFVFTVVLLCTCTSSSVVLFTCSIIDVINFFTHFYNFIAYWYFLVDKIPDDIVIKLVIYTYWRCCHSLRYIAVFVSFMLLLKNALNVNTSRTLMSDAMLPITNSTSIIFLTFLVSVFNDPHSYANNTKSSSFIYTKYYNRWGFLRAKTSTLFVVR